jgi:hypothetical protein
MVALCGFVFTLKLNCISMKDCFYVMSYTLFTLLNCNIVLVNDIVLVIL